MIQTFSRKSNTRIFPETNDDNKRKKNNMNCRYFKGNHFN